MFLTIAFYHFVSLENIKELQPFIHDFCHRNHIKGTIVQVDANDQVLAAHHTLKCKTAFIKQKITVNDCPV